MATIEVLFFDVLGTVVDWRGSIADEVAVFLKRHNLPHIDAHSFADAWVGNYDAAIEPIRSGQRAFTALDNINMENLKACLAQFGLAPSQFASSELEALNLAWHKLRPWPDAVEGITQLKKHYIVAPLSDGSTRLLVDMAKHAHLPWDMVFGADISRSYKPAPRAYLHACELLDVHPQRAMLVAAHGYDLDAARTCGLKTAYVLREHASDPSKVVDAGLSEKWDHRVNNLIELAKILTSAA
ncbi:haloacid dehalogenase type II [Pseudaminobacter salicylatoxidans]|uniref:haloacid dehalogenase type II n=1 Tax=Pseudaminobacter salicylatoxidans TaxID=93369 RepID=UPI0002E3C37C|nr:haloacid dehalogenase type II [Pseudaminobacter salicylatoxidans]